MSQTRTFGHSAKSASISPVACATAPTLSDWVGTHNRAGGATAPEIDSTGLRHERGGARGIDGETWSEKVEKIRNAVGCDTQRRTDIGVRIDGGARLQHELEKAVIPIADADIHARQLVRQSGQGKAGIFHGVISELEQKQVPQIVGASHVAGQPTTNTNDRDRFDGTHDSPNL